MSNEKKMSYITYIHIHLNPILKLDGGCYCVGMDALEVAAVPAVFLEN